MRTITVNIKQDYTLGELLWNDVLVLQQLVSRNPEVITDLEKGYNLMCITIAMSFKSYFKTVPIYRIFKKYKYWRLSKWQFIKRVFPQEAVLMFNEGFQELQPKVVKKK